MRGACAWSRLNLAAESGMTRRGRAGRVSSDFMKHTKSGHLSKKELSERWKVTARSVERIIQRYGLKPADFFGRQPEFDLAAVESLERRRREERAATLAGAVGKREGRRSAAPEPLRSR